jgi:pre-mRNA-splicing factor ATP-dependent RNA helicase DHX15/PRP43
VASCNVVRHIHENLGPGDILLFLTGAEDVERVCTMLNQVTGLSPIPLYSALPFREQQKVFGTALGRRCIVSTNIAETSLTIDGIVYVVDTGLVKRLVYNPRTRLEILRAVPISKAAALQRTGRAGRTRPGKCFRLYTKEAFDEIMPESTSPTLLSEDICSQILRLKSCGYTDLTKVSWVDPPHPESVLCSLEKLYEW